MPSPLACIIVHYGDINVTCQCIASLIAGTVRPWMVVVCNTPDAEYELLSQRIAAEHPHCTDICFVPRSSNTGFAAACNVGCRLAQQREGIQYIWLLNNDTTVAPDAAEKLLHCLQSHPQSIIGTSVYRANAPEVLELALGCRFSPWTTRLTRAQAPPVDYVYGASMAFAIHALDVVGYLDEQFFLYYEEHDFCLRAKQAGYHFYWCREAAVWHGVPAHNTPAFLTKAARQYKHYHETVSTVLFMRKHYPRRLPIALLIRTLCKCVLLPLRGEASLLRSYFQGMLRLKQGCHKV